MLAVANMHTRRPRACELGTEACVELWAPVLVCIRENFDLCQAPLLWPVALVTERPPTRQHCGRD
mgnify:CR=1 FL=1